LGRFRHCDPPPLGVGTLLLADGSSVKGFICEPAALDDATDITSFGGWRAYLNSRGDLSNSCVTKMLFAAKTFFIGR